MQDIFYPSKIVLSFNPRRINYLIHTANGIGYGKYRMQVYMNSLSISLL